MRGSLWNFADISLRSGDTMYFRLQSAILNFCSKSTFGNIGSVIIEWGVAENVGVAVGIASLSVSIQKLFLLPVVGYLEFR